MGKKSAKEKREARKVAAQRNHSATAALDSRLARTNAAVGGDVEYVAEEAKGDVVERADARVIEDVASPLQSAQAGRDAAADLKRTREGTASKKKQRAQRATMAEVKLRLIRNHGTRGITFAKAVDHGDANAPHPDLLAQLKAIPNSVNVPLHWEQRRAFLAEQKDRDSATDVLPPTIERTGVRTFRPKDNGTIELTPDQVRTYRTQAVRAFLSIHPKDHNRPPMPLTGHGDVFFVSKSSAHPVVPGHVSKDLRAALGIGAKAPPPWLFSMQTMGTLPPNLEHVRFPGLNAALPPGEQWGQNIGNWGLPVRDTNGDYKFKGVTEREAPPKKRMWGDTKGMAPPVSGQLAEVIDLMQIQNNSQKPAPRQAPQAQAAKQPMQLRVPDFNPNLQRPAPPGAAPPVYRGPQEYRPGDPAAGGAVAAQPGARGKAPVPIPPANAARPRPKPTSSNMTKF